MHKTIKYFYLEAKVVKRLDKGITAVLRYTRDKMVSRLIKITKGHNNSHIQNIHKRHQTALTSSFNVTINEENIWLLVSHNQNYVVSKRELCQISNCHLKCSFCHICIHDYECTCTDFFIKAMICKHIHYIHLKSKENNRGSETNKSVYSDSEIYFNETEKKQCLVTLANGSINSKNIAVARETIAIELNKMQCNINKCPDEKLQNLTPYLLKTIKNTNSLVTCNNNLMTFGSSKENSSENSLTPSLISKSHILLCNKIIKIIHV